MFSSNCLYYSLLISLTFFHQGTVSVELISYEDVTDPNNQNDTKFLFQQKAIEIAGGVVGYKRNLLLIDVAGNEFKRAEFVESQELMAGNGRFITRYFSKQAEEVGNWDARLDNAKKFETYNLDNPGTQEETPKQDMISNHLSYSGMMLYTDHNEYIMSTLHTGGVQVLHSMMQRAGDFIDFLQNPFNRLRFYLDLVRIWKVVTLEMGMKICTGSPFDITVRVPDNDNPVYRPIFRHPEWAVGLDQPCENFQPDFASKSVLLGVADSSTDLQKNTEVFTLARLITFVELFVAHHIYDVAHGSKLIMQTYTAHENKISKSRTAKKYEEKNLLAAQQVYRKLILSNRKKFPTRDKSDENEIVEQALEGMFDMLDKMVCENEQDDGRLNLLEVEAGINGQIGLLEPLYTERRIVLI